MLLLATVTTFEIIAICAVSVMIGVILGFALCAILSAGSDADDIHERAQLEADSAALKDMAQAFYKCKSNDTYFQIMQSVSDQTFKRLGMHANRRQLTQVATADDLHL
ncbi:MAG: hypothetical protein ABJI69_00180 [Balneola sp.]